MSVIVLQITGNAIICVTAWETLVCQAKGRYGVIVSLNRHNISFY